MRLVALALVTAGCRIGFGGDHAGRDAAARFDAALDGAPIVCPASYVTLGTLPSRYLPIDNSLTWLVAEQACEADGHHLVIIDDATELSRVAASLAGQNIWTGVTDRKTIGTFLEVTGGAASYLPWDTSEPDATALECTFLDGLSLKLADQDCTSGRRAVCECDGNAVDPATY